MISVLYKPSLPSGEGKDINLHIGDTLRVKNTVVEGGKSRVQTFEGILIAMSGRGENKTIMVRRVGDRGIGVERIWPLNSRSIVDIEVKKKATKVRRSKLYYLRELTGKDAVRV
ncbi:50S ribosomal protein L19 [Candidatus Daviesbacteria bacterium]|nr:50S ribosomal protein L19 [Candidatus Daviesbacteria bacterium]